MAEKASEYAEPHFSSREFKLEAVRLSDQTEKSAAQQASVGKRGRPTLVLTTGVASAPAPEALSDLLR
jgi:hypothetical protein